MIGKTRLRQLREERNLKQTTVAQETGLSRGTISNYESGMTPSTANGTILAAYYGVSLDYILGLTDERNADVGGISKSFAVLNKLTDGKGPSASDVAALLDASVAYLCNGAPCGMTPIVAWKAFMAHLTDALHAASSGDTAEMLDSANAAVIAALDVTKMPAMLLGKKEGKQNA